MNENPASIEQRSEEWIAARLGMVTASRVSDAIARTRNGWAASRAAYMNELLVERLTGRPHRKHVTEAMEQGTIREPDAVACYTLLSGNHVEQTGFWPHPVITMAGASPDGLVGNAGLLEVKCPQPVAHVTMIRCSEVPERYRNQCLWQMACTGRLWCDFLSWCPEMPPGLDVFHARVERDDEVIKAMEEDVKTFLAELDEAEEFLRGMMVSR